MRAARSCSRPPGPARAALPIVDDDPAVAARGAGDMRAVIRGSDGALWTRSWDGSSWTAWTSLGGILSSGPSISARPDGIYDVVARGTDGAAHHKAVHAGRRLVGVGVAGRAFPVGAGRELPPGDRPDRRGRRRHGPGALLQVLRAGQRLVGLGGARRRASRAAPSIISPRRRAARDLRPRHDDQLYEKYWSPSTSWSDYLALGGGLSSGVAATAWDANRRDIFARGTDGALWIRSWTNTGGSGRRGRASAALRASGPGATAVGPNRLHVFVRDRPAGGGQQLLEHLDGLPELRLRAALQRPAPAARRPRPDPRLRAAAQRGLRLHPAGRPRAGARPHQGSAATASSRA